MKKSLGIKLGSIALVLMMAMAFIGCDTGGGGGGSGRAAVQDGTFIAEGWGWSARMPMTVATTISHNAIVHIAILDHDETVPIMHQAERLLIPRIIREQSVGVDGIAGATASSMGLLYAVSDAIDQAGGVVEQWMSTPRRSTRTAVITDIYGNPYDVIVVGLGLTGVAAFLAAAEGPLQADGSVPNPALGPRNTTVIGIEWGGGVGGTSATAGGSLALNSEWITQLYPNLVMAGAATIAAEAAGLEAPALRNSAGQVNYSGPVEIWIEAVRESFGDDREPWDEPGAFGGPGLAGGARMEVVRKFFEESGRTIDWLGRPPYNMSLMRPSLWGVPIRPGLSMTVHNWGTGEWVAQPPIDGEPAFGFPSDDPQDWHKPIMWERNLTRARSRNPSNQILFETRAMEILRDTAGNITGVRAVHQNGTTFLIQGRSVILATGGFIGNDQMLTAIHGVATRPNAVTTNFGDGIRMAQAIGARTYNLHMAGSAHIGSLRHLPRTRVTHPRLQHWATVGNRSLVDESNRWQSALAAVLQRGNNLIIATERGQDGVDRRGMRFVAETGGATHQPIGIGTGLGNSGARAGGFWAAIYSRDQLLELVTRPVGAVAGTAQQNVPVHFPNQNVPADQPIPFIEDLIDWGINAGLVVRANTISELANRLGVPYDRLRQTIEQYNQNVAVANSPMWAGYQVATGAGAAAINAEINDRWRVYAGNLDRLEHLRLHQDIDGRPGVTSAHGGLWNALDFHRIDTTGFGYGKPLLGNVNQGRLWDQAVDMAGPFYAILGATMYYGTVGGLDINERFEVLNAAGNPIDGLYAGGQDAGGVIHHRNRLYSTFGAVIHGFAGTSGRWAGYYAATFAHQRAPR